MRSLFLLTPVCVLALSCGSSRQTEEASARAPRPVKGVVAVVDSRPITALEVTIESKSATSHETGASRDHAGASRYDREVLDEMVRQELAAGRAVELGLDADEAYQQELRALEAQLASFKRKRLSELYYGHELAERAKVDDSFVRAWFDAHAGELRAELHVRQILLRDRGSIDEAAAALAQGADFEEVAARPFASLPPEALEKEPWDLGWLRWHQIPDAWRDAVYRLPDGGVSPVIEGPKRRYWIVQVVERRTADDVTFESVKPLLVERLRDERTRALRSEIDRDLRRSGRVVYPK
jgi:hypothetical protein